MLSMFTGCQDHEAILTGAQTHLKRAVGVKIYFHCSLKRLQMRLEVTLELFRSCASYFLYCILLKSSSGLVEKHQALFRAFGIAEKFSTKTHILQ